jgi:RNA polymerase sigma factor (sigma-70 family)
LYKIVFPKVKNSIKRNNGSAEDAADVFQEAISYFYKRVISNTFNEKYTPYGFIYSMSINRWLNQIRKTKRISLKDNFDDIDLIETTDFEENSSKVSDEKKDLLQRFFKDLGETCIDLLHLSIFKSISYDDIAIRLNLNNGDTVKMQVYRCKQRLLAEVNKSDKLKNQLKALL